MFVYIPLRTPVPPNSPAARLVLLLDELCAAIAARGAGGLLTKPLFFLLWGRLRRAAVRAIRIAARITAGTPPPAPRPRTTPRPPRPPTLRLPGGFAWVVVLVPGTAAFGTQLQGLLAEPELARLAGDPAMRRLLNPLCRMLGVPARPSRPPRRPAAAPAPAPARDWGSDPRTANVPSGRPGQNPLPPCPVRPPSGLPGQDEVRWGGAASDARTDLAEPWSAARRKPP